MDALLLVSGCNFVEAFGIEPFSTAAESPESNGICERVGLTIRTTIDRIVKDSNPMNIREALTTAVVAHNSMSNVHGYSPHQLVFGQQRRSPALQDMSQPQIDQLSSSDPTSFAARVANILTARAQFAALDADARLLRAMNAPHIRDVTGNYTIGDKVIFYSDDASKERRGWHGPATVVGVNTEAKSIHLAYASQYYTRHFGKVRPVAMTALAPTAATPSVSPVASLGQFALQQHVPLQDGDDSDDAGRRQIYDSGTTDEQIVLEGDKLEVDSALDDDSVDGDLAQDDIYGDESSGSSANETAPPSLPPRLAAALRPAWPDSRSPHFQPPAVTLKDGHNLRHHSSKFVHPVFLAEKESTSGLFQSSRETEIENILASGAVDRVERSILPAGTQIITTRFVDTWKLVPDTTHNASGQELRTPKSRLVAHGFKESVSDEILDAPTATRESFRLLCFTAVQKGWSISSTDIARAFLQTDVRTDEQRPIAVLPPVEAAEPDTIVWMLRKSLYGLRSAPRDWYKSLVKELQHLGLHQCINDPALFTLLDDSGSTIGALCIHVDDIFAAGNNRFYETFNLLQGRFHFGRSVFENFTYCGIEVISKADGIHLSQRKYVEGLEQMQLSAERIEQMDAQLGPEEVMQFRQRVGSVMWVAVNTRPDVAAIVSHLASRSQHATVRDSHTVNKVVRDLKATSEVLLSFRKISDNDLAGLRILGFSDAAFQNLSNGGSQGGHVITITPDKSVAGRFPCAVIAWQSHRVRRVVRSTIAAEIMEAGSLIDRVFWVRSLFNEVVTGKSVASIIPVDLKSDCESFVSHVKSLSNGVAEKRLVAEIHAIRESLTRGEIRSIQHISTKDMVADGMTKYAPKLRKPLVDAIGGFLQVAETGLIVSGKHLR